MNEQLKQNDAFVAYLSNQNASVMDYIKNGINADNTQLLTADLYKNTPLILKTFSKDGVFNAEAFNAAYENAKLKYFELGDEKALQNFIQWSPVSSRKPIGARTYDPSFKIEKNNNPYQLSKSLTGFNVVEDQFKTEEELAQSGKIWDTEKGEWIEGKTAESQSLLSKLTGKTLVYAQYDKDDMQINPVTGEIGYHRKGEWMTDENGKFFTMTIDKKDLGNKHVVSVGDILTKEGTFWNKLDFWDSDGFDKSIGGIAMKTAVTALPYFIPGVNAYYGALTAALGIASVMPTFFKAMDSVFTGDQETSAKTAATELENWFRKFSPSKSRTGLKSFFSIESIGELLADVFGQLHQQLAAAKLVNLVKNTPEISNFKTYGEYINAAKKFNDTLRALSLGYMGLISTSTVYNDALTAGYDSRTAGLAALASAGALFGIMNFNESARGLGTWFLNKTTGYSAEVDKGIVTKATKKFYELAEQAYTEAKFLGDSTKLNKFFGDTWANAKSKMQDIFVIGGEGVWKHMIVEGVEEVTEEVVQDTVKGITDTLSSLGYTSKQGSFGGWSNVFSKEGLSRYLQTFVGGAIGGAVFDVQQNKIDPWIRRTFVDPSYKSPLETKTEYDLIDIIFDGREDEAILEFNNLKKIFNTKRGATSYSGLDENGQTKIYNVAANENEKTQADVIVEDCIRQLLGMSKLIKGQLGIKDFKSLDAYVRETWKTIYSEKYRTNGLLTFQLEKLKENMKAMWTAYTTWQSHLTDSEENKTLSKEQLASEKETFETLLQKCKSMFSGEESTKTLLNMQILGISVFDNQLNKYNALSELSFEAWYDMVYRQEHSNVSKFEDLPLGKDTDSPFAITQKAVKAQWEMYKAAPNEESRVKKAEILTDTYLALLKLISKDLKDLITNENKQIYLKKLFTEDEQVQLFFEMIQQGLEISDEEKDKAARIYGELSTIGKTNPYAFSLNDRINFDLAKILENKHIIDLKDFNDNQKSIIRQLINTTAALSRLNIFNKDSIDSLLNKVNIALGDSTNIYTKGIIAAEISEYSDSKESTEIKTNSLINAQSDSKTGIVSKDIHKNLNNFDEDINISKFNSIIDLIGNDQIVSPEMERLLVNYTSARILSIFLKHRFIEYIQQSKEDFGLTEELIFKTLQKVLLKNHTLTDKSINGELIINSFLSDDDISLSLPNSEKIINTFLEVTQELDNIKSKLNGKIVLEINPLQNILEKIHFALTKTDGRSLYEYLFDKEFDVLKSNFSGDLLSFTDTERDALADALNTINVLNLALTGAISFELTNEQNTQMPLGINQIQISFLLAFKNGKGIDDYILLSEEDFDLIKAKLEELNAKLATLRQIDLELTKSKSLVYAGFQKQKITSHKLFYKSNFLRTFKLELPDNPQKEFDLLEGFDSEQDIPDPQFVSQAEEIICKNLRKIFNSFKQDTTQEGSRDYQFILLLLNGVRQISVSGSNEMNLEDLLSDGIYSWNAIRCTQNGDFEYINGTYLLQKLTKLLYLSPKEDIDLIKDIYTENPSVSPRVDLEDALMNINFLLKHTSVFNDLEQILSSLENEITEESPLIKKQLLSNVGFLFGSGGSGKTLLLTLLSKHYKNSDITVTAMNKTNVDNLIAATEKTGDTLYNLFANLQTLDELFKNAAEEISKLIWKQRIKKESLETADYSSSKFKLESKQGSTYTFLYEDGDLNFRYIYDASDSNSYCLAAKFIFDESNFPNSITSDLKENSILTLDECTQLSPYAQYIISTFAKKKNIKIIEAGDPILPGWTYNGFNTNFTSESDAKTEIGYDISEYRGAMLANLFGIWRADITAIQEAISKLYRVYSTPQGNERRFIYDYSITDLRPWRQGVTYEENIVPSLLMIPFEYAFENDSETPVKGFILNKSIETTTDAINRLQSVSDKTIIVPKDTNKDTLKEDIKKLFPDINLDNWNIVTEIEALGKEFDNVLIYGFNDTETVSAIELSKKAFMLITRGKKSVITLNSNLFGKKGTQYPESKQVGRIASYQPESQDKIAKERIKEIQELSDLLKQIELNPTQLIPGQAGDHVDPPIDPSLENSGSGSGQTLDLGNGSDPLKDEKDNPNYMKEIHTVWKDAGFTDVQQLGGWYTRLGIFYDPTKELPSIETLTKSDDYTDLSAFAKVISALKTNYTKGDFDKIKIILKSLNIIPNNIRTTEQLIKSFCIFKTYLFEHINDFKTFIWAGKINAETDSPFEKLNQQETENDVIIPSTRGGVFFVDDGNISNPLIHKFHFTCGAFNTNTYNNSGKTETVSETLSLLYKDESKEYIYFDSEIDNTKLEEHEKHVKKLPSYNELQREGLINSKLAIIQISGPIQMVLEQSEWNKTILKDLNLKYGRTSLKSYLDLGYEIVDTGYDIDPNTKFLKLKSIKYQDRKVEFAQWIELFRFLKFKAPELQTDQEKQAVERLLSTCNRHWIILRKKGSSELLPVMVSKTIQHLSDNLKESNNEEIWKGKNKYLNEFILRSIIRCLLQDSDKELLKAFDSDLSIIYDGNNLIMSENFDNIIKSIIDVLHTKFSDSTLQNEIDYTINSWVEMKKRNVISSFYYTKYSDKSQDEERGEAINDAITKKKLLDINKIISDKSLNNIGNLLSYLDTNFEDYFYDAQGFDKLDQTNLNIKIERIYEPSKKLWDFTVMKEYGKSSDGGEKSVELSIENLKSDIITLIRNNENAQNVIEKKFSEVTNLEDLAILLAKMIGGDEIDPGSKQLWDLIFTDIPKINELYAKIQKFYNSLTENSLKQIFGNKYNSVLLPYVNVDAWRILEQFKLIC